MAAFGLAPRLAIPGLYGTAALTAIPLADNRKIPLLWHSSDSLLPLNLHGRYQRHAKAERER